MVGLASVFLFVVLAAAFFGFASNEQKVSDESEQAAANIAVANVVGETPKEPLAELGITPGNAPEDPLANAADAPPPAPTQN